MKIGYITDTGTRRTPDYFKAKGIHCIPLQIALDNKNYQDMEELSVEQCIENMRNKKIMATSLPSLGRMEELFQQLQAENVQRIIAVPVCNGLSGTMEALRSTAKRFDIPITIFDTSVTAVIQEYLIEYIKESMEKGISENEIEINVTNVIASCNTLIVPDDLQHLK